MQQARTRTESMVQRFAKKPISEGYELWDRDYPLGALRLFTFKSESAPPFLVAPCLDSMAEICVQMKGFEDASEQYCEAAAKYAVIQQPVLAELMRIKNTEVTQGTAAALAALEAFMATADPQRVGGEKEGELKTRSALARCYAYWAELLLTASEGDELSDDEAAAARDAAREHAALAVHLGYDRVHVGYGVLGDCEDALGHTRAAVEAYEEAVRLCPHYAQALERLTAILREEPLAAQEEGEAEAEAEGAGAEEAIRRGKVKLLGLLDQALEAHPRAALAREKAFLLSELEGDAAALQFLEVQLQHPPVEETANSDRGSRCVLLKAKAAVLADGERFPEALEAAKLAVEAQPEDAEALSLVQDIESAMSS